MTDLPRGVRARNRFARPRGAAEVLDGVMLLGTHRVNFYAVTEGRSITLVDCGFDGHWRYLDAWLTATGRRVSDIEAVVLTHGHADHIGFASRLQALGVPVHLHERDSTIATHTRMRRPPQRLQRVLWRPAAFGMLLEALADGVARQGVVREPQTFVGGATLDVPGRFRVVDVPGHTAGSVAFLHPSSGGLFTGDALMTRDPMLLTEAPVVFAEHTTRTPLAFASLHHLLPYGDAPLLPAHGDPWTDTGATRRAIDTARPV